MHNILFNYYLGKELHGDGYLCMKNLRRTNSRKKFVQDEENVEKPFNCNAF